MYVLSWPKSLKLWRRRVSVAALLVLHALIAGSELFEPVSEVRLDTHAEQHGNRHPFAHDSATCAVCSVQLQQAAVPPRATFTIEPVIAPAAMVRNVPRPLRATQLRARTPRAPPTLT